MHGRSAGGDVDYARRGRVEEEGEGEGCEQGDGGDVRVECFVVGGAEVGVVEGFG